MSLSPELKRLARQALTIQGSQVPSYMALEILASNGDTSRVQGAYRDIKEPAMRRALHDCAALLRAIAVEAGLAPEWDPTAAQTKPPASKPSPTQGDSPAGSATQPSKTNAKPAGNDDLTPFVDESARGQVRVAKAYTDGASKGNPGPSGIGVVIFAMDGRKIAQQARAIGIATNNIAEYSALIEAMTMAKDLGIQVLNVISDSELMVRQVTGVYKIKNVDILKKAQEVMQLRRGFEKFSISYVGREHNKIADALSTSLIKKKSSASRASADRDFMGKVDTNADDGATE